MNDAVTNINTDVVLRTTIAFESSRNNTVCWKTFWIYYIECKFNDGGLTDVTTLAFIPL